MKKLLCLLGGALFFSNIFSQKITPLTIGDTIPNLTLSRIVNYKAKSARLSDFKDRLIIFDFWATWCTSCLAAIPHSQTLQKQFGDSIMVMLVNSKETRDTYEKIIKLFQKQSRLIMPSITGDTVLTHLFPHREIPHYVWVYNQVVRAITSPKELTPVNIRSIISDSNKRLPTKNDFPNFNSKGPFFTDTAALGNILEHSILTRYTDNFQAVTEGSVRNSDGLMTCFYCANKKLSILYSKAYPVLKKYSHNRIIKSSPLLDSIYCYDLQLPASQDWEFFSRMREDLDKAFHLSVEEQILPINCLVLTKKYTTKALFDTLMASESTLSDYYDNRYIHNFPMRFFYNALNEKSSVPIIDETGITGHITIDGLPTDLTDVPKLKKALAPYGLDISFARRMLKVCVIKPKSKIAPLSTNQTKINE